LQGSHSKTSLDSEKSPTFRKKKRSYIQNCLRSNPYTEEKLRSLNWRNKKNSGIKYQKIILRKLEEKALEKFRQR